MLWFDEQRKHDKDAALFLCDRALLKFDKATFCIPHYQEATVTVPRIVNKYIFRPAFRPSAGVNCYTVFKGGKKTMGNMEYCRFGNTVNDLQDCYEHMDDADLTTYEVAARQRLIGICIDIVTDYGDDVV